VPAQGERPFSSPSNGAKQEGGAGGEGELMNSNAKSSIETRIKETEATPNFYKHREITTPTMQVDDYQQMEVEKTHSVPGHGQAET
jgi:hypothetical protein